MGTRGFIGFVVGGKTIVTYNHSDSYPAGLGQDVLTWVWANRHSLICPLHRGESGGPVERIRDLRVVSDQQPPTAQDIERLRQFADFRVDGCRKHPSWYQLLRTTQGDIAAILRAGAIEDASGFPADSLFAEWGYVIDLDAQTFEVYEGFQHRPHTDGRFAHLAPVREGYWPCRLVASWPLDEVPYTMPDEDALTRRGEAAA